MGWQNRCEVDRRDLGPGWGGKSVVRWIAVIRATVGWQNPEDVIRATVGFVRWIAVIRATVG